MGWLLDRVPRDEHPCLGFRLDLTPPAAVVGTVRPTAAAALFRPDGIYRGGPSP